GVFTAHVDGVTRPNSPEVSAVEYVSLPNLRAMIASGQRTFTPTFLKVLDLVVQRRGATP
ncbi:MAG TPA: hypothetical protein VIA18_33110, partial [Polyangia bacterium]|nr:hypothetical protein [Polyangia bacterium]